MTSTRVDPEGDSIPRFGRDFSESGDRITRIGDGRLGGKARGLVVASREIVARLDLGELEEAGGIAVNVPRMTVLTTDLFDAFMERNDLWEVALSERDDDSIAHAFQRADLPAEVVGDLRALAMQVHSPLAVRSSSLLEDALRHPFAGIYGTKMIPNHQPDADTRFRRLVEAVKLVFASTFFRPARDYIHALGLSSDDEKMAVLVQEVVGERFGDRYYPTLSGVARSFNYYPTGHATPQDGVVNLALGLGKTIVEGGTSWTYCPAFPRSPPPFDSIKDGLRNTQTRFWAVHMGRPPLPDPIRETEYLIEADLEAAELDGTLRFVASTYDPGTDRLYPGVSRPGPRLVDFAPILVGQVIPLNAVIAQLLDRTEAVLGTAAEIELAATFDREHGLPARIGFLQARPMQVSREAVELSAADLGADDLLVASEHALGNGVRRGLSDIVFVKPDVFEARHTRRIAAEIGRINRTLLSRGRPYLLIGFGRWGSADPYLGIPVRWGQIGGAAVIVEASLPSMSPELSQGSHFFHNLISFQVIYLSVPSGGRYAIDWEWLLAQETVVETRFVRHVRTHEPLSVHADGRCGRGLVRRHEG